MSNLYPTKLPLPVPHPPVLFPVFSHWAVSSLPFFLLFPLSTLARLQLVSIARNVLFFPFEKARILSLSHTPPMKTMNQNAIHLHCFTNKGLCRCIGSADGMKSVKQEKPKFFGKK